MSTPRRGSSMRLLPEPPHITSPSHQHNHHRHQRSRLQRSTSMGSTSSRGYPVGEPSVSHHRDTSHRQRQNHGSSSKNDRPKHRHHRSKAHYSTSHSPLRGRRRYSSRHKQGDSPNISPNDHRGSRHKRTPSDDGGLLDVLAEILGRGEQGPDAAVLAQLADKFGELIVRGLVDRLVSELESGLLEKILMDYLMDLVKGSVRKGLGRGAHRAAGRGKLGSYDDDDDDDDGDWKKSLLKKAVMTVAKSMMKTER